jgi:nucleotide-binding universal stress UspA family protein
MQPRIILHPTDYSELSRTALRYALELAAGHQARLLILHVVERFGCEQPTYGEVVSHRQSEVYWQRMWGALHRQVAGFDPSIAVELLLGDGEPTAIILQTAAERRCDLIVLASHDRHGWDRWLFRSTAERVLGEAPCPVLAVKPCSVRDPGPALYARCRSQELGMTKHEPG